MTGKRLSELREEMKRVGVQWCVIPTSDCHNSEYVSSFFMVREYFSGFTGSAGTLLVGPEQAFLFTDGRYFIQAKEELAGTGILLMKMGEPEVPTLYECLEQHLQEGERLGFDGRVVTSDTGNRLSEVTRKCKCSVCWDFDPAAVWKDRPELIHHPIRLLSGEDTGESVAGKLERVREVMKQEHVQVHILTSLDDIAWLYNIRSNDVECCPVALAYTVITQERALLFAEEGIKDEEVRNRLVEVGVELYPYEAFYETLGRMVEAGQNAECWQKDEQTQGQDILQEAEQDTGSLRKEIQEEPDRGIRILLDQRQVNYRVLMELKKNGSRITVVSRQNPTIAMKAVKNETELAHIRNAHLKDAVAVTRFMYWLKKNIGKLPMDEASAASYLDGLRAGQEGFWDLSFPTISAYGTNGAIVHYSPKEGKCAPLKPEGMLLVDSGGHYIDGTTDITRTFILGPVTQQMKEHYTLVLRAMLSLRATRFLYGCTGENLDIRAREVLWEQELDYKHGTGHGIGHLLNVHEGPQSFRWKHAKEAEPAAVLEEGMITSDEPGIYLEGQYGIRIENELLCRKGEKNSYGQFMYFEDLTFVPIDLDGVEEGLMSEVDKERLNTYHQMVCEKLEPYFTGEEREWLRYVTRKI